MKYLTYYAEPEAVGYESMPGSFSHVLVIPVYDELINFIDNLLGFEAVSSSTLIVLIVNVPEVEDKPAEKQRTGDFLEDVYQNTTLFWQHPVQENIKLLHTNTASLLVVDRISIPIPAKQGVGLARKVGADIACQLIHQNKVACPWIFNTDADVKLPSDYFISFSIQAAAYIFPFRHVGATGELALASYVYELSLHYYVAHLQWAGSPYAFHTIGSTIAINYVVYAMVRGFPKRSAGEDFYLLNKLAKIDKVIQLDAPVLEIQMRTSSRVPFGTGPAVNSLIVSGDILQQAIFYHPDIFSYLKLLLYLLPCYWDKDDLFDDVDVLNSQINQLETELNLSVDVVLVHQVLEHFEVPQALAQGKNNYLTAMQFENYIHAWLDGFRTLKLIHYLRDNRFSSLTLTEALRKSPVYDAIAELDVDGVQHLIEESQKLINRPSHSCGA